MARLSLSLLLLLSFLALSFALDVSVLDKLPESEPSFLPQLPNPESESETEPVYLPQLPNPEQEEKREIPELPIPEPEEKPELTETVQYIVIPVNRLHDVRDLDDIGFSLRLPMRDGHRHQHHRVGGPGDRFGRKFGHRFVGGFPGGANQMEVFPGSVNRAEDTNMETPEMTQLKEALMRHDLMGYDETRMPMDEEEKIERAKEMMKKMRKCKHHHMERGMHMHHDHHHEHHHGPREEPRDEREEGGFMKQFWNFFNF